MVNVAYRSTNRVAERTIATRAVDLKQVKFGARQCGVTQTSMLLPYLDSANGGDIIYHASATHYLLNLAMWS
ncbi:hypothetical protein [Burkholderia sp. USMB20]|uniref:hypothetical protein n=1 Tax=Burkholderia sp. USMB20 TaxID=1571773 RepID=UPI0005DF30FE|nr:hypothetical protein [Burkholderia sp. USMB20]TGN95715.1 hypothetical protein PL79_021745 [Burkholderia sp. USMB20]